MLLVGTVTGRVSSKQVLLQYLQGSSRKNFLEYLVVWLKKPNVVAAAELLINVACIAGNSLHIMTTFNTNSNTYVKTQLP